jgi:hypothetical protein
MENMESILEETIKYLQDKGGQFPCQQLPTWDTDTWSRISRRLVHSGYLTSDAINQNLAILTEKGWEFESFEKIREEKQFQRDLLNSNLAAAKATENVSNDTATFYTHQTSYNSWQKGLTIAIMTSAILSAIVSTCAYFKPSNSEKSIQQDIQALHQQVYQLKNILNWKLKQDSTFEQAVKDSLKMK